MMMMICSSRTLSGLRWFRRKILLNEAEGRLSAVDELACDAAAEPTTDPWFALSWALATE